MYLNFVPHTHYTQIIEIKSELYISDNKIHLFWINDGYGNDTMTSEVKVIL